ncbi:SMC family ATPase [Patescibacteria group bacterium]|nr:SMC family ATPase [Patescibacteria group bacterium]MCL5410080.1 SMC family ATPase [Patescibacteria group bacterium]
MIPTKLKLSNFTSYGTSVPELNLTDFNMAAISGQNGAGKSSLLDSITWCLWGTSRVGDSADQLIRLGQTEMSVEVSFELDKHLYTVKRQRIIKSGGTTTLELWSGTHNLTEGTIKATQQKIIDLLHLSFETFVNSAFIRQGHADEFTTKGPTERKRILADILSLGHYDQLEEKAKEKVKEIQTSLQLLGYQLLEIEAELSQKEERTEKKKIAEEKVVRLEAAIRESEALLKILREERESLSLIVEQRQKLEQNYQQNKQELTEIIEQGKRRRVNIAKLEEELAQLATVDEKIAQLKDLQIRKEKLDQVRQQKLELEKQLAQINSQISSKKERQQQLQQRLAEVEAKLSNSQKTGAKCPTCGQEMGHNEKAHAQQTLTFDQTNLNKQLKEIDLTTEEKEVSQLEKELAKLSFNATEYLEVLDALKQLEKFQQQKEAKIEKQATLESEKKVVLEMRSLFQNKNNQVEKLQQELVKLPNQSAKLIEANQQLHNQEKQLESLRSEEKDARAVLGQVTELISRTAQMEKVQAQKNEDKVKLQQDKEAYEELAQAFGKKGIQAMIIENAIPEIEEEANSLLDRLTEGRMKIHLETQRETKTKTAGGEKGLVETLDIVISDEMGERSYEAYSGGEQFRVNLAIRLALSKLLTHRAGSKLQFLVIDEGFGTQDAQGRSRIVEALDVIKNDFAKILVITHLEELKEEFPVRIEVSKGPSGSTFEVVGV